MIRKFAIKALVVFLSSIFSYVSFPGILTANNNIKELTLKEAIQIATTNNYLIKETIEKQRAALEAEKSATADLLPKLSASYSYMRLKHSPYAVFSYSELPIGSQKVNVGDKDNYGWDVTMTQPLFTGFALITKRKIAQLGVEISKVEHEQAILDITKQVKIAYYRILLAKRLVDVAEEEVRQLEAHAKDAELFYKQELIPRNDVLKSKVALAQAKQKLVKARSDYKIAVSALNNLLGWDISKTISVEDISGFKSQEYHEKELFEKALKDRPELRILRTAIQGAELGIRMARSAYFPNVYLVGRYEQKGEDILAKTNNYTNSHNASIGVEAKWTFFEWGKTRAEVKKTFHQKNALVERLKGIEDSVKLEVRDAIQRLNVAKQNVKTAKKALAQAKENYRITNLQYQQQVTTSTEVLDARTYLTQAEVNFYGALYGYMMAEAELARATGRK
ncbi:MAG TPA: TolC family protein [Deltaproteobacteria bacterium]|nr:TolC family protein [Deltaproteobacteria bacterium]